MIVDGLQRQPSSFQWLMRCGSFEEQQKSLSGCWVRPRWVHLGWHAFTTVASQRILGHTSPRPGASEYGGFMQGLQSGQQQIISLLRSFWLLLPWLGSCWLLSDPCSSLKNAVSPSPFKSKLHSLSGNSLAFGCKCVGSINNYPPGTLIIYR